MANKSTSMPTPSPGEIRADSVYRLADFKRRAGLRDWAFRTAKQQGLRILAHGRNRYVAGSDWIAFLHQKGRL